MFTLCSSFFVAIACYFFGKDFAGIFNAEGLVDYLYLIPVSILFVGFYQSANFYANRFSKYKFTQRIKCMLKHNSFVLFKNICGVFQKPHV